MNKKLGLVALLSTSVAAAAASFALLSNQQSFVKSRSDVGDYTITINPEDITSSTESADGQVVLKTDQLKNDVKFNFENVKRDGDNLVILEDGFIANAYDSQIRSIKNVVVYGGDQAYDYAIGWEASGTSITYAENDYSWASGIDLDLSSFVPNYFKMSYRAIDVTVSKIVIEFDHECVVGENPTVIQGGLKYRKVGNDHAIVVGFADSSFANVVIADTVDGLPVTEIAGYSFRYNTTIESLVLGANVETIGSYAFCYASNLTSVSSFANVKNIGYAAFQSTNVTGDIVFSSTLEFIDGVAFMDADLTSITFADTGNPYVGDGAFRSIETLESAHIGSEMNQFYEDFFQDSSLESITVGAGNTKYSAVENVLFDDQNKVVRSIAANRPQTSFTVPSGYTLKTYCSYANQTLETLTLGDSTECVPDYSFNNCPNLHTINFGSYDGVNIQAAFQGCTSLATLNISSNVAGVWQRSFEDCTSLETVVFEEGCTRLDREAFNNCTSLKNVLLPTTLTSLGAIGGWSSAPADVFNGCTSLTKICTRLSSGTYSGEDVVEGWNGGRSLAYESVAENLDGNHWRMVDGTPRVWGTVNVTFKIYRNDIGTGYGIYFLGTFNAWTADVNSRGSYVTDHWEFTIDLVSYVNYEFKGAVGTWDDASNLVYEVGNNHSWTPDDSAYEYVINWQY